MSYTLSFNFITTYFCLNLFVTLFKRKGSPIDSMTLLSKSSSTAADRDILVVQSTQTPKKARKLEKVKQKKHQLISWEMDLETPICAVLIKKLSVNVAGCTDTDLFERWKRVKLHAFSRNI